MAKELLEEKLNYIEMYVQGCRALMVGKNVRFSCGAMIRTLLEIEDAAHSVFPYLDRTKNAKQRMAERYTLLREAGWL
jgi:hypothetical protein